MNRSRLYTGGAAAVGMLLLILESRTALAGAAEGLSLCIRTVIPSLFPFFVLSILLTGSLTGTNLRFLRPVGKLLGIPLGAEAILAAGFLGGYPVGAQSIAEARRRGQLTDGEARRMLAFCNNAGPAFLFGMAASLFPVARTGWILWGIHILSALLVGLLLPGGSHRTIPPSAGDPMTITAAMRRSITVMAQVCGWVVLFRVVITFLTRWFGWLLPVTGQVLLSGILELSNGCCALAEVGTLGLRFVICSGFLGFGGLCVTLQTLTVADGLDTRLYFPGKVLQTVFSVSISMLVQRFLWDAGAWEIPLSVPVIMLIGASLPFFLIKFRNKSRNPAFVGV